MDIENVLGFTRAKRFCFLADSFDSLNQAERKEYRLLTDELQDAEDYESSYSMRSQALGQINDYNCF